VDLDVVFLGTSGSAPTAQRAPSALLVRRGGDRLLVDCAEGTQRQLLRSDVGLAELREVFLTHYHADHYLGLPGMMKTFAMRGRELPLTVYGPPGLRDLIGALRRVFGKLPYPLELVELRPGDVIEREGYAIEAFPVRHGVAGVGYALVEEGRPGRFDVEAADRLGVPDGPARGALQRGESVTLTDGSVVTPEHVLGEARRGRKIVIAGDTAPAERVVEAAAGADLLVHEATFCSDEQERADETPTRLRLAQLRSPETPPSYYSPSRISRVATAAGRSRRRPAPSFRARSCRATSTSCISPSRNAANLSWSRVVQDRAARV
jgi:ribonuclease Z